MGKQSARLYYRGKDHKDIYFQGKYHNAMIVRKEDDAELVWRKLYDEGYFVYTRWTLAFSTYSYNTAILYPKYKIREFYSDNAQNTYHSNKYLARKYAYSSLGAIVSADGKLWKRIEGNNTEVAVMPKADGIVIVNSEGGTRRKYTYISYENGKYDEENALVVYSDLDAETATSNSIFNTTGITDFLLLLDNSKSPYKAFAVDMSGNVYNNLFTVNYPEIGGSGCYNGMYYCVFTNVNTGCYVYVSNSIDGPWERRSFPVKATDIYTIQSDDKIVIYIGRVNNNASNAMQIYTTTDFINYTPIDIPISLTVPIIEQVYDGEKKYIRYMLANRASEMEDAYNYKVYNFIYSFIGEMARGTICYIEKCKISPPKGMIIQHNIGNKQVTVHLDNLFFQESEGNFAFFEELYPEAYMNDYLEKSEEN